MEESEALLVIMEGVAFESSCLALIPVRRADRKKSQHKREDSLHKKAQSECAIGVGIFPVNTPH